MSETVTNGNVANSQSDNMDSEPEIDEKELEEQVEDLVEIRNKTILKKNLRNIVRENLVLKAKLKRLEGKLQENNENNESYNLLFRIDVDGDEDDDQEVPVGNSNLVLSNTIEEEVVEEKKNVGSAKCFNCLGDHLINDCPQPKDPKAIAKNRREFQSRTAMSSRYHVDERFGHLRPGLPSDKLRSALRLRKDQIPEYIYRMREFGYPPGWLREAEINSSGINLYHERGEKLGEMGDEDGEVIDDSDKTRYNMEKLIDWPGFNSPLPKEFEDETRKYRALSYSAVKTLKQMKDELRPKEQQGYVRGKMQDTSVKKGDESGIEEEEEGEIITLDSSQDSQELIILDSTGEVNDEDEEMTQAVDSGIEGKESVSSSQTSSLSQQTTISTPSRQSSISSSTGSSISKTEPGTPICEIFSPFTKLPGQTSFGKDMSEHIVFENLPDYTGKWDQMKGLISRIRKRKKVNEEDN